MVLRFDCVMEVAINAVMDLVGARDCKMLEGRGSPQVACAKHHTVYPNIG